jgi:hypothetical protein
MDKFYTGDYIKLDDVKPEVKNVSDKYSWNIYRFLRKHKNKVQILKQYRKPMEPRYIYMSSMLQCEDACCRDSMVIGTKIYQVMHGTFREWASYDGKVIDITKDFILKYRDIGICLLNPKHNMYEFTWDTKIRVRTCTRCGLKQRKKVICRKTTEWIVNWEDI